MSTTRALLLASVALCASCCFNGALETATTSGGAVASSTTSTGATASTSGGSTSSTIGSTSSGSTSGTTGVAIVSTLAGDGSPAFADGTGGPTGSAAFSHPAGVAAGAVGDVYVADSFNNRIRKIDMSGNVTTVMGNGTGGFQVGTGGPSGTAELGDPADVTVDASGNLYFVSTYDARIWKLDLSGNVTILAGSGMPGDMDGSSGTAEFNGPVGVAADATGNVYVADGQNNRIRKVDPSGNVTTLAGNGMAGDVDGTGGPSGMAQFNGPMGVAVDAAGNVYVADAQNNAVRKVDVGGNVTTLAGNGKAGDVDGTGGPSGTTEFGSPLGVAVDSSGNVYVADSANDSIRVIDPAGNVTTLAGNGAAGNIDGLGGRNGVAEFNDPSGVAVDSAGTVYVADQQNNRIRKISP